MATIAGMLRKWEAVNLLEDTKDVLAENAQEIVQLQQQQWFQDGLNGDNVLIPSMNADRPVGYANSTVESGYVE